MRLLGEAMHRLRHAVKEEGFAPSPCPAMAIGGGNQLLCLRHGNRGEEVGK